jgi:hypothetical protein
MTFASNTRSAPITTHRYQVVNHRLAVMTGESKMDDCSCPTNGLTVVIVFRRSRMGNNAGYWDAMTNG